MYQTCCIALSSTTIHQLLTIYSHDTVSLISSTTYPTPKGHATNHPIALYLGLNSQLFLANAVNECKTHKNVIVRVSSSVEH